MNFDPEIAEIRFGCGLSPVHQPVQSADEMLARLTGPDAAAATYPIPHFNSLLPQMEAIKALFKQRRTGSQAEIEAARAEIMAIRKEFGANRRLWLAQVIGRRASTSDGFRERLMFFWADHFTAKKSGVVLRRSLPTYWEEAIRPNLTGSFRDLLIAAVTHPMMLLFLDQTRSIGPNSQAAKKRKGRRGLNENLAREVLELHTLGVDGPYTQKDVRELAELFTGLAFNSKKGFFFAPHMAEPGAEQVLGNNYGADPAALEHVHQVLSDLARHPVTARHIARKLAVHFVSDTPDPALIEAITQRYLDSDGDLVEVYQALLSHPSAWSPEPANVKLPIEFVSSALRALAVTPKQMNGLKNKKVGRLLQTPLEWMGQTWDWPRGPDGWPEQDENWVTPQAMAMRMQWALVAPQALVRKLPDPREFVTDALGSRAPEPVKFAARAAATRWEGVALVLASPAFQRR